MTEKSGSGIDREKSTARTGAPASTQIAPSEGTWPTDSLQRAFVEGAAWWEVESTKFTMWSADRDRVEAEAVRRFGNPPAPKPPFTRYDISIILTAAKVASMDPWYFREDYVEDVQEVIDAFRSLAERIELLIWEPAQ